MYGIEQIIPEFSYQTWNILYRVHCHSNIGMRRENSNKLLKGIVSRDFRWLHMILLDIACRLGWSDLALFTIFEK